MPDKRPPKGPNSGPGGWGPVFLKWLDDTFPEPAIILEFGSGLGTRELTRRGHLVHSVEHDAAWVGVAGKSTYHYAPIVKGWYDFGALQNIPTEPDLVIIDGPTGIIGRKGILRHPHIWNQGPMILVDDVNRPEEMRIANEISKHCNRGLSVYKDGGKSFAII